MKDTKEYHLADSVPQTPEPDHESGRPTPTHESTAERERMERENEEARDSGPTIRERMVDIGRGNQQAGR